MLGIIFQVVLSPVKLVTRKAVTYCLVIHSFPITKKFTCIIAAVKNFKVSILSAH